MAKFWGSNGGKGKNRNEGKKSRWKREEENEIWIKKEGNYSYFVSLFNIGPYYRKEHGRIFKNNKGGGGIFRVAIIYTPGIAPSLLLGITWFFVLYFIFIYPGVGIVKLTLMMYLLTFCIIHALVDECNIRAFLFFSPFLKICIFKNLL